MLLMHWTSSCTIKHDTETVRLYFIEAKDALVADGRCLLFLTQVSHVSSIRPERAEAPSPGHRPGLLRTQTCRPVRAKALKLQTKHKAFALTGRLADCYYTQGDALG